ncbi:MAG: energy transducer TonB [Bacteroidota bacterium]
MHNHEPIRVRWDDMVFEDREQAYGAYQLRKRYPRNLMLGVGIASLVFVSTVFTPLIARYWGGGDAVEVSDQFYSDTLIVVMPPPPEPPPKVFTPPPPPPPKPPEVKQLAADIPLPTPEEEVDSVETIHEVDSLLAAPNLGFEDIDGIDSVAEFTGLEHGTDSIPEVIAEPELPGETDFIFADEEPRPVNMRKVVKLIGYPQMARDAGIEGTIVARVLVDKNGRYRDHRIINSAHPILQKAVEKHLNSLTFTPAVQGGNPIPFWVNIPFRFHLM